MTTNTGRTTGVLAICLVCTVLWSTNVFAEIIRFKQFVAPLDCVKETIDNGVTVEVILSPQECYDLLNPKPEPEPEPEPQPEPGKSSKPSPQVGGVSGPNTGFRKQIYDTVVENADAYMVTVTIIVLAILLVRIARRKNR